MHYKGKKINLSNLSLFHSNIQLLHAKETSKVTENGDCCQKKKNRSQRLSLSGARISRPERDFVGLFSVSAGVGARESTLEDIGILAVVVLPYGMLVDELFAGLLDELFGLRWILFLRR